MNWSLVFLNLLLLYLEESASLVVALAGQEEEGEEGIIRQALLLTITYRLSRCFLTRPHRWIQVVEEEEEELGEEEWM